MQAVILSGGEGTRLRPLTNSRPKPMLPLLNRPFLQYPLTLLKRYGVREVVLCTGYRAADFHRLIPWTQKRGIRLRFSEETKPLGTAGALSYANLAAQGPLWVLNGDALTDMDLGDMKRFHISRKSKMTISLVRVPNPGEFGLVQTDSRGRVLKFLEKPKGTRIPTNTINAGIYLFEPEILGLIPKGRKVSLEREIFPEILSRGWPFYGYCHKGYWLDIGTAEKYLQAHEDILRRQKKTRCVGAKSLIERGARFQGFVSLGAHCRVARGSSLSNCVILDGTRVEGGARISRSIVGQRCRIGRGVSILHKIIADGSVIGERK